jgi:hypothetical protein
MKTNLKFTPPDDDYALSNAYVRFHLSNGEVVYEDKDLPSFWFRLQEYLKSDRLRVKLVVLKFRSHEIHFSITPNERYLYFSLGAGRDSGNDVTDNFYILGRQDNEFPDKLSCVWYKTPELTKFQEIYKDLNSELFAETACEMPI